MRCAETTFTSCGTQFREFRRVKASPSRFRPHDDAGGDCMCPPLGPDWYINSMGDSTPRIDNAPTVHRRQPTIEGWSRAGIQSCWRSRLKIGFDLGCIPWDFTSIGTWFVSHAHIDHRRLAGPRTASDAETRSAHNSRPGGSGARSEHGRFWGSRSSQAGVRSCWNEAG